MSFPSHPSSLDRCDFTSRKVEIMKLAIMQFSPTSCHFISLRPKFSLQHPVFKYPQYLFPP
jgi:hypothetical protein